tara:strand:- start:3906 stop:4139 length:234 start_codon:yes stop_codon:yes gene_type:complete
MVTNGSTRRNRRFVDTCTVGRNGRDRKTKKRVERNIVLLSKEKYKVLVDLLRSIPGNGTLAAMILITELVDMYGGMK